MWALGLALLIGAWWGWSEYLRHLTNLSRPRFQLGTPKFDPEEAARREREGLYG